MREDKVIVWPMFALAASVFLLTSEPALAQSTASVYRVVSITGGTLTQKGKTLKAGTRIVLGGTLQVSGGAKVMLEAGPGGRLLISGPASFTPKNNRFLLLKAGRLLSSWKKLTGEFKIATPAIVASVRGTEFFLESRGANEAYLCVCSGTVEVLDPRSEEGGQVAVVKGDHHSAHSFKFSGSSFLQTDAAMASHTDKDIAALRASFP